MRCEDHGVPSWDEVTTTAPELAKRAQAVLDAHKHKTIATLRADGSPRISGTEATFRDGELWLGMMLNSRKALDLRRDPRLGLHSATVDPEMAAGDAKLSGRAVEVSDRDTIARFVGAHEAESGDDVPSDFHLFRVDVRELSVVRIGDPPDHLVIESWSDDGGYRRVERT